MGQDSITLAWNSSTNSLVAGYVIYYGTSSQKYTLTNNAGTNNTVTLTNLQFGTNYYFAVACYSATGMQSPLSTEVTAATAPAAFFSGQQSPVTNVEWLQFPSGSAFGYYSFDGYPWIYHDDLGYEFFIDAQDGQAGAYLFDFDSGGFFYTSPTLFPYLYDFTLNAWLFYYSDPNNPGHYTSNPRVFYNYTTQTVINK